LNKSPDLILLIGSFVIPTAGKNDVYGVATVLREGFCGIIFNQEGVLSTIEGFHVPVENTTRLSVVTRLAMGDDDLRARYILQRKDNKGPFDTGVYSGRSMTDFPAIKSGKNALASLGESIAFAANASIEPAEVTLMLDVRPWHEVYRRLTPKERRIADVVVMASQFDNVLGPDAPHLDSFYSWVLCRAIETRQGADELTPWSLPESE
jgi:hypothetical protein